MNVLCVALGGALGAGSRYVLSLINVKSAFPFMTFLTNILGAIFIGLTVGWSIKRNLSQELILFFKTGFCGGFTTFSTFSLESFNLMENGYYITAIVYIILSVTCCIIGVWAGMKILN